MVRDQGTRTVGHELVTRGVSGRKVVDESEERGEQDWIGKPGDRPGLRPHSFVINSSSFQKPLCTVVCVCARLICVCPLKLCVCCTNDSCFYFCRVGPGVSEAF